MNGLLFAQNQTAPATAPAANPMMMQFGPFIPLIIIFFIFYFLLILPQQKKQKAQKKMLDDLQRGDKVVTVGGAMGEVDKVKDQVVTIKFSENVSIDYLRNAIAQVVKK